MRSLNAYESRTLQLLAVSLSQLHTRLLSKYAAMAMVHGSVLTLVLFECMERYRIGFGRTESTFINIISTFLNWKVLLLGV